MLALSIDSVLDVFTAVSGIAFFGGVILTAIRASSPVREIPWWWWIGSALSLLLLAFGNQTDLLEGVLLVVGAFSLGIGLTKFGIDYKSGKIRIRRAEKRPSQFDVMADLDWEAGARLVRVLDVLPAFALEEEHPYVDMTIVTLGTSLHAAEFATDVKGRIRVPDRQKSLQELTHPPELQQVTSITASGSVTSPFGSGVRIGRHEQLNIVLRQHLVPALRDLLLEQAGKSVEFNCEALDVGLIFERWTRETGGEKRDRDRLRLGSYRFEIPESYEASESKRSG